EIEKKKLSITTERFVGALASQHNRDSVLLRFSHDAPLCAGAGVQNRLILVVDHGIDGAPKGFRLSKHEVTYSADGVGYSRNIFALIEQRIVKTGRECLKLDFRSNSLRLT